VSTDKWVAIARCEADRERGLVVLAVDQMGLRPGRPNATLAEVRLLPSQAKAVAAVLAQAAVVLEHVAEEADGEPESRPPPKARR
jgi:hypothetical protein